MASISTEFWFCDALSNHGARELIAVLQAMGTDFYLARPDMVDTTPEKRIDKEGNIFVPLHIGHPAIRPGAVAPVGYRFGTAKVAYLSSSKAVILTQDASFDDVRLAIPLADQQCRFARELYHRLLPQLGRTDVTRERAPFPSNDDIVVRHLYWANFFGPRYVERLGRQFLLEAPAHRVEDLDDGGLLLVTRENILDRSSSLDERLISYFRRKCPEVTMYNRKKGRGCNSPPAC